MTHPPKFCCALVVLSLVAVSASAVTMDYTLVGDPGNAPDTRKSYMSWGDVGYLYKIGKYEVTNGQYIEFLNAVAATDTHGLYHGSMQATAMGGIKQSGVPTNYSYGPKDNDPVWLDRPVNFVGFWDACRFVNWLHNGQPSRMQDLLSTEDGAYFLNGVTNPTNNTIWRQPDARVWIPNEDEWHKAAYYGGGPGGGYWDYPTGSNTKPAAEAPPGTDLVNGSANYTDGGSSVGSLTAVGAYSAKPSASPYGAYDMGGNVAEWTETIPGINQGVRIVRGGDFSSHDGLMLYFSNGYWNPGSHIQNWGFRVATVPEPGAFAVLLIGGGLALLRRRR